MVQLAAARVSPDGTLCASAGGEQGIQVRNASDGALVIMLPGNTNYVSSLAFSPDSRILATGAQDGAIHLWQLEGKYVLLQTLSGHTGKVTGLAFSTDGKLLASASEDGTVRIWGISTP